MSLKRKALCGVAVFVLAALALPAGGSLIYGTGAPLTGSRSVGTGLTTTEPDWQSAEIEWLVADNGDGTLTYTYTLRNFAMPDISHVTLDITDDCVTEEGFVDPDCVTSFLFNGRRSRPVEFGDQDGITGAVKFDVGGEGDLTYSFVSNREPVYGDVFIKGGETSLTNTGFGDRVSEDAQDYIARPNGVAPEPAALVLLALGGAALLGRRKR